MSQEQIDSEENDIDLGYVAECNYCDTEFNEETKYRCPVCGKRIRFPDLSAKIQYMIMSLWIAFPSSAIFFLITISNGIVGGFFDTIWGLIAIVMQFFTYFYGIKWIILEFRSKKRIWWKIGIGLLMFILELYFVVFSSIFVLELFSPNLTKFIEKIIGSM